MSLTLSCACGLKYKVREDNRGKTFHCQGCGARIVVPEAEAAADNDWGDSDEADLGSLEDDSAKVRGERLAFEKKPGAKRAAKGKSSRPGAAVPDGVEKFLANLKGLPVNRNLAVRVEVAGRKHWPLKEIAAGFAEYLSKHGFTVDPNAKTVYRLVLDYKSVSINRTGLIGPAVSGDPGVAFRANLDVGTNSYEATIYMGFETFQGQSSWAPKGITVDEWESKYPAATKAARDNLLKSVMKNQAFLRGVGTSADHESYYLAEGDYSVPRPLEGDFPVDGYHQPSIVP